MQLEEVDNMPSARVGGGSTYGKEARFVLKILPDMDRDKAQFEQRLAARRKTKQKKNWLGWSDFPKGTAGYLYARVWELGKAARVILDECVVAGLTSEIRVNSEFNASQLIQAV